MLCGRPPRFIVVPVSCRLVIPGVMTNFILVCLTWRLIGSLLGSLIGCHRSSDKFSRLVFWRASPLRCTLISAQSLSTILCQGSSLTILARETFTWVVAGDKAGPLRAQRAQEALEPCCAASHSSFYTWR